MVSSDVIITIDVSPNIDAIHQPNVFNSDIVVFIISCLIFLSDGSICNFSNVFVKSKYDLSILLNKNSLTSCLTKCK